MKTLTNTKRMVTLAMFCALAAVGGAIKIQGSIAFDSTPAFLAAMLMGAPEGAIAGAVGHLFSALLSGFPLTVPLHLVIAVEMAGICYLTGFLVKKKNWPCWLGGILAFVLNAFISPAILVVWPQYGLAMALSFVLPLALASAANVVVSVILAYALKIPYNRMMHEAKEG